MSVILTTYVHTSTFLFEYMIGRSGPVFPVRSRLLIEDQDWMRRDRSVQKSGLIWQLHGKAGLLANKFSTDWTGAYINSTFCGPVFPGTAKTETEKRQTGRRSKRRGRVRRSSYRLHLLGGPFVRKRRPEK